MFLAWLELRDFRNHAHTKLAEIPEGLVVVVAPNGEGKTNLLEGMHCLYGLSSPRTSSSEALVRRGSERAFVRGEVAGGEGRTLIELEIPRRGATRIQVDRSPVRRRRDVRSAVRAVLFGPFDLPIVIGDPSRRRAFMDEAVVALRPADDTLTSTYERVLRQRNRLLREWDGSGLPAGLDAWDEQLIQTGSAVIRARSSAVERLAAPASEEFAGVTGYGSVVRYLPSVAGEDLEGSFRDRLDERRGDELQRRTSLVGPHRDDLDLAVRDMGARAFASHGETAAAALSLRLGLATAIERNWGGERPLLLVDDPYSALDPERRDRVAASLAGRGGQVVITVADEADVPREAAGVWDVRGGVVSGREAA